MGHRLSERQSVVLAAIYEHIAEFNRPPTVRRLAELIGIASTNGVMDYLKALERKGFITRRGFGKSHSIQVVERWETMTLWRVELWFNTSPQFPFCALQREITHWRALHAAELMAAAAGFDVDHLVRAEAVRCMEAGHQHESEVDESDDGIGADATLLGSVQ